jgi:class 3 adenylate cyclase
MENNAAELEQDVQQRTMELLEEQKKADVLLYRMMPREAADKLKLGQSVEPQVFESASVFFSDIVSFTVLASKSTPLQIISFLNDVYTLADGVIDKYDVYKVRRNSRFNSCTVFRSRRLETECTWCLVFRKGTEMHTFRLFATWPLTFSGR